MPGRIEGSGSIQSDGGSTIAVENVQIPGDLRGVRGDGIGFGPLRLTSWAESTTSLNSLVFEEADTDSWIPFLSAVGLLSAEPTDDGTERTDSSNDRPSLTRRGLLVTIGASTLLVGSSDAQSDDERTYDVASFDLTENLRGLKVDVDVGMAEWLEGEDVDFFLSVDEKSVGAFTAGDQGKTLNPGTTGSVALESDTALSFVEELIAKASADDKVVFEFRPQDTSFASESVDTEIELSSEPVVVETVDAVDPEEVVLKMNGTVIPHTDDSGDKPAGEWWVRDGTALMYAVGPETPDTSLVEIQVNVGRLERLSEEYL